MPGSKNRAVTFFLADGRDFRLVALLVVTPPALITDGDLMFALGGGLLADDAQQILLHGRAQLGQVPVIGPVLRVVAELDEALLPQRVHLDDRPEVEPAVLLLREDVLPEEELGLLDGRRRIGHRGLLRVVPGLLTAQTCVLWGTQRRCHVGASGGAPVGKKSHTLNWPVIAARLSPKTPRRGGGGAFERGTETRPRPVGEYKQFTTTHPCLKISTPLRPQFGRIPTGGTWGAPSAPQRKMPTIITSRCGGSLQHTSSFSTITLSAISTTVIQNPPNTSQL